MLDPALCRHRQRRLLAVLENRRLDVAILSAREHVYWLTGHYPFWLHESAAVLRADGRMTLVTANAAADCPAADDVRAYTANRFATQRMDQPAAIAEVVTSLVGKAGTIGVDAGRWTGELLHRLNAPNVVSLEEPLHLLRKRKEADELKLLRKAIDCTAAMYDVARRMIEPGISEIAVFNALHGAAVETAGEPLRPAYLGNDFACGDSGGAPRNGRTARTGEIWILDLGPAYRGYFADNARAFAVDRNPTDAQMKAWDAIAGVFPIIERTAKPGVRCRDLFAAGRDHLHEKTGKSLDHHLGHGVGLFPHEYPHINPEWDDVLEAGDVFTIEPGLYSPEINGGMRIENQYLVTATGVENLTPFPMALT